MTTENHREMTSPRLDAIALVEAHLHDEDENFDALITASDDPDYLRQVIATLADMAMAEIRDHHPLDADAILADFRQYVLQLDRAFDDEGMP